jgi:hypothetical protein
VPFQLSSTKNGSFLKTGKGERPLKNRLAGFLAHIRTSNFGTALAEETPARRLNEKTYF